MVCDLDNRKHKGSHGAILQGIYDMICELSADVDVFVREQGFSRFSKGTQTLFKVVGVADLAVWRTCQSIFYEVPPTIVKKTIAGKGNATKGEVAAGLVRFVGVREYACDDQSDAVGVGIAWMLENGLP